MFKSFAVLSLLLSGTAMAQGLEVMAPNKVFVDSYKNQTVHDPYLAPDDENLGWGASFNINFDIVRYNNYSVLYMDNNLHFDQEEGSGQIRAAGWQYSLNLVLIRWNGVSRVELFRQHHSQHIMDRVRPDMHFPVYDRNGIRVVLFDKDMP